MVIVEDDAMNGSAHASTSSTGFDFALDPSLSLSASLTAPLKRMPLDPALGGDDWTDDEALEESDDDSLGSDDDFEDSDETDAEDELEKAQAAAGKRGRTGLDKGKGRATELDIDGPAFDDGEELGRLISAIRESEGTGVGGRTALEKEFDRQIEEELDDVDTQGLFEGKAKRKRKRGMGRRAAAEIEPSAEVKLMLGASNRCYALGQLDEAIEILTDIVRIDPSIRMPWFTLATIHEEKGDKEKSVMFKIVGTHLGGSNQSAHDWAVLGGQSRDIGLLQQAIYCFSQAIKADKADVDSMWDRAFLLKMSGSSKQAIRAFIALLDIHPHDPGVMRELTPLLAAQEQHDRAFKYLLAAYDYFRLKFPIPENPDDPGSFGAGDLESLADLLLQQKRFKDCVHTVKEGVRWLQGRAKEKGWDNVEDDREFDEERKTRPGWERNTVYLEEAPVHELDVRLRARLGMARLGLKEVDEAQIHFEIVTRESVNEFPELFGAVADCYFEHQMWDEAANVYQDMAEDEATNGVAVWLKIAECNEHTEDYEGAQECYAAVVAEEPDNLTAKFALARMFEAQGKNDEALPLLKEIMEYRRAQKHAGIRVPRITGLFEATRKSASRKELSKEPYMRPVPRNSQPRREPASKAARAGQTAADRAAEREEREEHRKHEFGLALGQLKQLDELIEEGDQVAMAEWLSLATYVVDSFRETRQLFPSDGKRKFTGMARTWKRKQGEEGNVEDQAQQMQDRLERQIDDDEVQEERAQRLAEELVTPVKSQRDEPEADELWGLDFDGWLKLIVKYAFRLTDNGEEEAGQETLTHTQNATVFKNKPHRTLSLRLARIACYMRVGDFHNVVVLSRHIILANQFHSDALRLLQAVVPGGQAAMEAYNFNPLQKFTIRQLRLIEEIAKGAPIEMAAGGQVVLKGDKEEGTVLGRTPVDRTKTFIPTKSNPVYLAAYAGMLITSRSWQSAIIYLLRAHGAAPEQPLIHLSLGVSYLSRAMSRQTDNREHQIAQAFGWFSQYRELVGPGQEVEYNFGRAFHQLGLNHYAVKHYEQCLTFALADRLEASSISGEMQLDGTTKEAKEFDDYAKVAAYNLSTLYSLLGRIDLAKGVVDRWLAV